MFTREDKKIVISPEELKAITDTKLVQALFQYSLNRDSNRVIVVTGFTICWWLVVLALLIVMF